MPLALPCSPATIKRIENTNKLLLIWNSSVFGKYAKWTDRWPLCSVIAEDEGETWDDTVEMDSLNLLMSVFIYSSSLKVKAYKHDFSKLKH